eukprot:TRINITY_DN29774_c0_g1_i1.p1 TRINITY_DN29774_c0_g1~~TRINITY_DN29774_c0_g1_i1.p1  ORF type:complete len:159 (-),score=7.52 TRINITY_DN29774_c0_g1_i1:15-491(-)
MRSGKCTTMRLSDLTRLLATLEASHKNQTKGHEESNVQPTINLNLLPLEDLTQPQWCRLVASGDFIGKKRRSKRQSLLPVGLSRLSNAHFPWKVLLNKYLHQTVSPRGLWQRHRTFEELNATGPGAHCCLAAVQRYTERLRFGGGNGISLPFIMIRGL